MILLLCTALVLQGGLMVLDELWFHRLRVVPRWERVGHPLDTLTMASCLGWVLFVPPSSDATRVYLCLAVFSALFVTKDELVHAGVCRPAEHWLHALLFLLHSFILVGLFLAWPVAVDAGRLRSLLRVQFALTVAFLVYQTLYWNLPWQRTATLRRS